jgi:predicted dehydrogenase
MDTDAGSLPPEIAAAIASGKVDPALLAQLAAAIPSGPAPGLFFGKPEVAPGEPLRLEIESFLDAVRTRRVPHVTARQGRAALELALEIQATMAAHAARAGLGDFFKS